MGYRFQFHPPKLENSRKYQTKIPIPAGTYGNYQITKEVLPAGSNLAMYSSPNIYFKNDVKFTVLHSNGTTIMSDTPMEIATNEAYTSRMEGKVLVAGLGLGIVIGILQNNPKVTKITVVEIDKTIIDINRQYQPKLCNGKVNIINANISRMKLDELQGEHYDWMYVDIWNSIGASNRSHFYRLKKKYQSVCDNFEYWAHYEIAFC